MRTWLVPLAVLWSLVGCTQPQPSAYVGGVAGSATEGVSLGANASGESCNQLPGSAPDTVAIFCGTWQQPAARIRTDGGAGAATPMGIATSGTWRDTIDLRFACDAPVATSILGDAPTAVLQCRRRIGGWPQVALVAAVGGRLYEADGILPTLPVIERSIGVLSGRTTATTVALPPSAADALLASQLAATRIQRRRCRRIPAAYVTRRARQSGREFRDCGDRVSCGIALQQKALGRDHPDTVTALMHLALQVSDQGRFAEADHRVQTGRSPGAAGKRQGSGSAPASLPGTACAEPGTLRPGA